MWNSPRYTYLFLITKVSNLLPYVTSSVISSLPSPISYYILPHSFPFFPLLLSSIISMLKTLVLRSSSLSFSHFNNFSTLPRKFPFTFTHFPCPFSTVFPRPVNSCRCKVLAMAERTSTSSSHSLKYTNRLATEHSPYLLQHAHNPVILSYLLLSWDVWDWWVLFLLNISAQLSLINDWLYKIEPKRKHISSMS